MIKELLMASALICAYPNTHQVKNLLNFDLQEHRDYNVDNILQFEPTKYYGNNDNDVNDLRGGLFFNELYVFDYLKHINLFNGNRVLQVSISYDGLFEFDYDSITNEYSIYLETSSGGYTFERDLDNALPPTDVWYTMVSDRIGFSVRTYVDTYQQVDDIALRIWRTFLSDDNMVKSLNDFNGVFVANDVNLPYSFNSFPVYCANTKNAVDDNLYLISGLTVSAFNDNSINFDYVDSNYFRNVFKVDDLNNIEINDYLCIIYSWNKTNYDNLYDYSIYYNGGFVFNEHLTLSLGENSSLNDRFDLHYNLMYDYSFVSNNELYKGMYITIRTDRNNAVYYIDYVKLDNTYLRVYDTFSFIDNNYRYIYSFSGLIDSRLDFILQLEGAYGDYLPPSDYDITNLIYDYANLPFFLMQRLFSFTIFGVQVWSLILSLITILLAIFVLRKVTK